MISFNNNKTTTELVIEIVIDNPSLRLKTSFELTRNDILVRNMTVSELKEKIAPLTLSLNKRDRVRVINHFVGSYHDYKKFVKNEEKRPEKPKIF